MFLEGMSKCRISLVGETFAPRPTTRSNASIIPQLAYASISINIRNTWKTSTSLDREATKTHERVGERKYKVVYNVTL